MLGDCKVARDMSFPFKMAGIAKAKAGRLMAVIGDEVMPPLFVLYFSSGRHRET